MIKRIKGVMVCGLMLGSYFLANYIEGHYTREGVVIKVENNNMLTIEDKVGYIWECGADGFTLGDKVKMKMNNNYTDTIEDDIILKVVKGE